MFARFPASVRDNFRASDSSESAGDHESGTTLVPLGKIPGSRDGPPYFRRHADRARSISSWVGSGFGEITATEGTAAPLSTLPS